MDSAIQFYYQFLAGDIHREERYIFLARTVDTRTTILIGAFAHTAALDGFGPGYRIQATSGVGAPVPQSVIPALIAMKNKDSALQAVPLQADGAAGRGQFPGHGQIDPDLVVRNTPASGFQRRPGGRQT
jgi:hypothetical protein